MTAGRTRAHGESATITLWMLGCCLMLLALGGISVDLWRSFSARRSLASAADAAALSGAAAIDEDRYRSSAELVLVPAVAQARARESLRGQLDTASLVGSRVQVDEDSVTVAVRGKVELSLLRLLDDGAFELEVVSTAVPVRSP